MIEAIRKHDFVLWIGVSEKPFEDIGERCLLVCNIENEYFIAFYDFDIGLFRDFDEEFELYNITHWAIITAPITAN